MGEAASLSKYSLRRTFRLPLQAAFVTFQTCQNLMASEIGDSMKGKVVLVTGANGGLGSYVTQAFLDAGAIVIGTSREIQQSDFNNPNFTALPVEISTREGAKTLVDEVVARFKKLDVLAHTVCGFADGQSIADTDGATSQLSPEEISAVPMRLSEQPDLFEYWRRHVPTNLQEIQWTK